MSSFKDSALYTFNSQNVPQHQKYHDISYIAVCLCFMALERKANDVNQQTMSSLSSQPPLLKIKAPSVRKDRVNTV